MAPKHKFIHFLVGVAHCNNNNPNSENHKSRVFGHCFASHVTEVWVTFVAKIYWGSKMGQTVTFNLTDNKVKNLKCHNSERNGHTQAKFWLLSSLVKFFQLTRNKENPRGKYTITWVIFSGSHTLKVILSSYLVWRFLGMICISHIPCCYGC